MIVDPDFLTHWKTRLLVQILGEAAPVAVISLWSHCQSRKEDEFEIADPRKLAGICGWAGDPDALLGGLVTCGFLDVYLSDRYVVHGWRERNKQITRMWGNATATKSKPKQPVSKTKAKPKQNQYVSNPIISNPIISNPVSEDEGSGEKDAEDGLSFGEMFDGFASQLATINPRWKPHPSAQSRRDAIEDSLRYESVTSADIALVIKFYRAKHEDGTKLCQSLSALLSKLPDQCDRAHAWKSTKGQSAYHPVSRPSNVRQLSEVETMSEDEHSAAQEEFRRIKAGAFKK